MVIGYSLTDTKVRELHLRLRRTEKLITCTGVEKKMLGGGGGWGRRCKRPESEFMG